MSTEKSPSKTFNEHEDFNVGDVVKLKSGSPNMTVDNASGSRIICAWFDADQNFHRYDFDQGALEKVEAQRPFTAAWLSSGRMCRVDVA